MVNFLFF